MQHLLITSGIEIIHFSIYFDYKEQLMETVAEKGIDIKSIYILNRRNNYEKITSPDDWGFESQKCQYVGYKVSLQTLCSLQVISSLFFC